MAERNLKTGKFQSRFETLTQQAELATAESGQTADDQFLTQIDQNVKNDSTRVNFYVTQMTAAIHNYAGSLSEMRNNLIPVINDLNNFAQKEDSTLKAPEKQRIATHAQNMVAFITKKTSLFQRATERLKNVAKEKVDTLQKDTAATLQKSPSVLFRMAGRALAPKAQQDNSTEKMLLGSRSTTMRHVADANKAALTEDETPEHVEPAVAAAKAKVAAKATAETAKVSKATPPTDTGVSSKTLLKILDVDTQILATLKGSNEAARLAAEAKEREGKDIARPTVVKEEKDESKKSSSLFGSILDGIKTWFGTAFTGIKTLLSDLPTVLGKAVAGAVAAELAARAVNATVEAINKKQGTGLGTLDTETRTELDLAAALATKGLLLPAAAVGAFSGIRNIWKQRAGIGSLLNRGITDFGAEQDLAGSLIAGEGYYDTKQAQEEQKLLANTYSGPAWKPPTAPPPTLTPAAPAPAPEPAPERQVTPTITKPKPTPPMPTSTPKKVGGSLSWRNNNPGNMRWNTNPAYAKSLGATGGDANGYAIFPSLKVGEEARRHLLFDKDSSRQHYADMTVEGMIGTYAPPADKNNVPAYVQSVLADTKNMGITKDSILKNMTAPQQASLMDAMKRHEGWKVGIEASPDQNRAAAPMAALTAGAQGGNHITVIAAPQTTTVAGGSGGGMVLPMPIRTENPDASLRALQSLNGT